MSPDRSGNGSQAYRNLRSDNVEADPEAGGDHVMPDPSFDVVSKVDRQEVDNALNQAAKEVAQRFDFRGTNASIEWSGELGVTIKADTEEREKAALDVFKEKLVKRSISMKALDAGEPKVSGKQYVITSTLRQ